MGWYAEHMKFSDETKHTMRSPVAKVAVFMVGAASLVLFIQIVYRML
jgi:hypothetical protein